MNLREFWAAEAAKLRDTSHLAINDNLSISKNNDPELENVFKKHYKNMYIIITNSNEQKSLYKDSGPMGTFDVQIFRDIRIAAKWLEKYYQPSSFEHLILDSHGNASWLTVKITETSQFGSLVSERNLKGDDFLKYFEGKASADAKLDIEALGSIMNRIKSDGFMLCYACNAGFGPNGRILLYGMFKANKQINKRTITIYVNQDETGVKFEKGQIQIWKDGQGLSGQHLKLGWIKTKADSGDAKIVF